MFGALKRKLSSKSKQDAVEGPQSILDYPLLMLSESDYITVGDACEGIHIFGAVGSGKSSGSGRTIALEFLRTGFGGLVLTAKPDELKTWQQYVKETGREDDLMVFSPESQYRFNFLDYESSRSGFGGGQTENIVSLFATIMEVSERGNSAGSGSDPFWVRASKQLLRNAVDLCNLSTGQVSIKEITSIIRSAPKSLEESRSDSFTSSRCYQLLTMVDEKLKRGELSPGQEHDYEQTFDYWIKEFPALGDKTRSGIVSTFTSMADAFLRGELYQLFCTETNITPEDSFDGKIIIIHLPLKQWNELGLYAQLVFKYLWQQAIERREVEDNTRPCFLWADESHLFLTAKDQEFLTTARSARACTVFLSQNIPNYTASLGESSKSVVDSLLGNFQTKIFHQNSDSVTNQWASEIIGKSLQSRSSFGNSSNESDNVVSSGTNASISQQIDYDIQPNYFTSLRKGGRSNGLIVDALVFQGGTIWKASGKNYLPVMFYQK